MKRHPAFLLTLLAIVIVFSVPSRADDDGNFCTSKGYLAYELREGVTPGVTGHVLKVVRFDPQSGIHAAGEVTLPEFQVHAMDCSADRIEIWGWGNGFKRCKIDTTSPQKVTIVECTGDRGREFDHPKGGAGTSQPGLIGASRIDPT